ncbi:MAG: hypothetical protein LBB36_05195 [Fibromonadaceae bacterium]|nr:hypothetical protein [Fibromonadaceae bacterium]
MTNVFYAVFFIAFLFSHSFGFDGRRCGTLNYLKEFANPQKRMLAKESYSAETGTVRSRETKDKNFIIYYTTEGPHAVKTERYIDSLAEYLEQAYKLHKDSLGMESISGWGATLTDYYRQTVPPGFYPIEVVDTGLIGSCDAFGLTFPPDTRSLKRTQISIENDFLYGTDCPALGKYRGDPYESSINGDYSKKWELALKATVFHELYHSFQLVQFNAFQLVYYYNMLKWEDITFWMEASAAGVEEIGAPDVNDYINYLYYIDYRNRISSIFYNQGVSMDNSQILDYSQAVLYLFLFSELGSKFDSRIWDYFKNNPKESFSMQLARLANELGIDADSLFHKYARSIFFSGNKRVDYTDSPFWDKEDMSKWPEWAVRTVVPSLPAGSIAFVRTANGLEPKVSASNTIISRLNYGDSSVWVLSRFLENKYVPPAPAREFIAYPNPWRNPNSNPMRFSFLPPNATGVEIRTSNGALLERIKGKSGDTLIWQPKKIPAPGILYYRYLPYGKNKVLIVEY